MITKMADLTYSKQIQHTVAGVKDIIMINSIHTNGRCIYKCMDYIEVPEAECPAEIYLFFIPKATS